VAELADARDLKVYTVPFFISFEIPQLAELKKKIEEKIQENFLSKTLLLTIFFSHSLAGKLLFD